MNKQIALVALSVLGIVIGLLPVQSASAALQEKILYHTGDRVMKAVNPDGTDVVTLGIGFRPRISPDGTKIAYDNLTEWCGSAYMRYSIATYIQNIDGSNKIQLANENCVRSISPVWSPDGSQIAYMRQIPSGASDVYIMNADGSNRHLAIVDAAYPRWSPDGLRIVFSTNNAELAVANTDGSNRVILPNPVDVDAINYSAWSPDGTRIAFFGGGGGKLWTIRPDGTDAQNIISANAGGGFPVWSPDSSKLLFHGSNNLTGVHTVESTGGTPVRMPIEDGSMSDWGFMQINAAPQIDTLPDTAINIGSSYSAQGSFSDPDSSSWTGTVDYGDGSGAQPLLLTGQTFSLDHTYTTVSQYSVTIQITDNQGAVGTRTTTIDVQRQLTALGPVRAWIGLSSFFDIGVRFDVLAQVYRDDVLVTSGQVDSFNAGIGGLGGFANARQITIPMDGFSPTNVPEGSSLRLTLSVRNACSGSFRNMGTARLWLNDAQANSRLTEVTLGQTTNDYFLLSNFGLGTNTGPGPKNQIDMQSGAKCSPFKPFGDWTITP